MSINNKQKDTSSENIKKAAEFLNIKPKKQGSNQRLEDYVSKQKQQSPK